MLRGRISQDEQTDRARKLSFWQCQSHWSVGKAVAVIDSVTHKTSRFLCIATPLQERLFFLLLLSGSEKEEETNQRLSCFNFNFESCHGLLMSHPQLRARLCLLRLLLRVATAKAAKALVVLTMVLPLEVLFRYHCWKA